MADIVANPLTFEGVLDHLTHEQTDKLKNLWKLLLEALDHDNNTKSEEPEVVMAGASKEREKVSRSVNSSSVFGSTSTDPLKAKNDANNNKILSSQDRSALENVRKIVLTRGSEKLKDAYWSYIGQEYPDVMMLKFLRARRWDVYQALQQLVVWIAWRIEAKVDDLLQKGEKGMVDSENFVKRMEVGEAFIQGTDRAGRPVLYVRVRLHKFLDSTESQLAVQEYVLYIMESMFKFMVFPNDKFTLLFDMTGFGLANMDWKTVHFLRQCFTQFYPECLNAVLVHNAPWVFWGIWKILSPLVDPVVKTKIQFTRTPEDLKVHIEESHLIKELGGTSNFEWQYIPVVEDENERLKGEEAKRILISERKALIAEYIRLTHIWIQSPYSTSEHIGISRRIADNALRSQYFVMEPYIHARGVYNRTMNILEDGRIVFVYSMTPSEGEEENNKRIEVLGEEKAKKAIDVEIEESMARLVKEGVEEELRPKLPDPSTYTVQIATSITSNSDEMLAKIRKSVYK